MTTINRSDVKSLVISSIDPQAVLSGATPAQRQTAQELYAYASGANTLKAKSTRKRVAGQKPNKSLPKRDRFCRDSNRQTRQRKDNTNDGSM